MLGLNFSVSTIYFAQNIFLYYWDQLLLFSLRLVIYGLVCLLFSAKYVGGPAKVSTINKWGRGVLIKGDGGVRQKF